MRRMLLTVMTLATLAAVAAPGPAAAQLQFGVRAGEYTDAGEPFVGVDLLARITGQWFFNPSFEYVFVDDGDLMTINGDVHYDFDVDAPTYVWAGGGPALILRDSDSRRGRNDDDNETDFGLNLLAGVGLRAGPVVPYAQLKAILSDENEFVVGFGVRF